MLSSSKTRRSGRIDAPTRPSRQSRACGGVIFEQASPICVTKVCGGAIRPNDLVGNTGEFPSEETRLQKIDKRLSDRMHQEAVEMIP